MATISNGCALTVGLAIRRGREGASAGGNPPIRECLRRQHGVAGGKTRADFVGFASRVIENNLSEGAIALFLQGCSGDINPVQYKDVNNPCDAEYIYRVVTIGSSGDASSAAISVSTSLRPLPVAGPAAPGRTSSAR